MADLDAGDYDDAFTGIWTRGLLIRRNITDGDLAFFSTWCPQGTSIETLVKVEGHRHVSLVMLAFAMIAAIRYHANAAPRPKTMPQPRH